MKHGSVLLMAAVLGVSPARPQTPSASPKKPAVAARTRGATTKTSGKAGASPSSAARKGKSARKPVVAAYRQGTPTPDRYREIQQALVDKGYLKSEPNGVWDDQSADALKQFQTDQKLTPTGKLSSASLIALGLGPKTAPAPENSATPAAPAAEIPAKPAN